MHRREINKIKSLIKEKGHTLVPLSMYWKNGHVKLSIGLAKDEKNKINALHQRARLEKAVRSIKEAKSLIQSCNRL